MVFLDIICFVHLDTELTMKDLQTPYNYLGFNPVWSDEKTYFEAKPFFSDESQLPLAQLLLYTTLLQVIIISSMFSLPLAYLVVIQTQNVFRNTTTYQRFSKFRKLKNIDQENRHDVINQLIVEQQLEQEEYNMYNSLVTGDQYSRGLDE